MIKTDIRDLNGKKVCVANISNNGDAVLDFKNVKLASVSMFDIQEQIDNALHKAKAIRE